MNALIFISSLLVSLTPYQTHDFVTFYNTRTDAEKTLMAEKNINSYETLENYFQNSAHNKKINDSIIVDIGDFSEYKDYPSTFNVRLKKEVNVFRFYTLDPSPSGNRNKGRIVIDNLRLEYNNDL